MSARLARVHWKVLECIFLRFGFEFNRQNATSHRVYTKSGCLRPVIIPTHKEVSIGVIQSNMRTAKMTREQYDEHLEHCQ